MTTIDVPKGSLSRVDRTALMDALERLNQLEREQANIFVPGRLIINQHQQVALVIQPTDLYLDKTLPPPMGERVLVAGVSQNAKGTPYGVPGHLYWVEREGWRPLP